MRVLVTGASGFAGRVLVAELARNGFVVVAGVRDGTGVIPGASSLVAMPDLSNTFDARCLVKDVDAVVHAAGLAHSSPEIPERVYQAINCQAARALAQASRESGVRRFIYVSSVRAQTGPSSDTVLTEADEPAPTDAYGRSKLAGEQAVVEALAGSQTDPVVLRPVLMYGPNAKGNMASLMRLARSRLPLPLGGIPARRSLLGLTNFSGAVAFALNAPTVSGRTFLLADAGTALTVGEILAALRAGLGRRSGIVNVPLPGMEKLLVAAGKADMAGRVFGDLVVSTDALVAAGWQAPMTSAQGLAAVMAKTGD
ncbi:MAG: NAD-dependent epimerase/dehydratase family protein [Hyphomicrobiaceae bacterium]